MRPTDEQQAVIDSKSHFLRVVAFAGSGKSTSLKGYARARPAQKMLGIAFSKAIQLQAEQSFPQNVRFVTSHGLAFPQFGSVYANANKLTKSLRVNQVAQILPLDGFPDDFKFYVSDICLKTLQRFFATAHQDIDEQLVHGLLIPNTGVEASEIVALTKVLWSRMRDPKDQQVGMLHDGYLKLYQLSNPKLPYEVILFDEAQDANPVTAALVESQQCSKVVVGDGHQAIFGFRLATNAMDKFQADETLYLTKSFRFGQEIADVANFLLSTYKGETKEIIGSSERGRIGVISPREPVAVVARGNATLFGEAISAMKAGKKVHFVGGVGGYRLDDMMDAYNLWAGNHGNIANPYLRSFKSFDAMEDFARAVQDRELSSLIGVVQRHSSTIPTLISRVRQSTVDDPLSAHVHLATGHKSKGLEWNNVRLADDYFDMADKYGRPKGRGEVDEEEVNIAYVAATRAKKVLQPFPVMQQLIDVYRAAKKASAPAPAPRQKPEWARAAVTRR